jgi:hypothetical protein
MLVVWMQINGSQVAVAMQRLLISKMVCGIVTLVLWQVHTGSLLSYRIVEA